LLLQDHHTMLLAWSMAGMVLKHQSPRKRGEQGDFGGINGGVEMGYRFLPVRKLSERVTWVWARGSDDPRAFITPFHRLSCHWAHAGDGVAEQKSMVRTRDAR
jgi:hypothetical protein